MDLGVADRVALVLGSTAGLGSAVASLLAHEGALVAFTGRRVRKAEELAEPYPGSAGFGVDLADRGSVSRLVEAVVGRFGAVDILVLNSGGPPPLSAAALSADALSQAFEMMVARQIDLVDLILPAMRAGGWGRIVAIGSTSIQSPLPDMVLSNTARSALASYLKTLAAEVAPEGVTVNMVLPGRIATDRILELDDHTAKRRGLDIQDVSAAVQATIPAGRYGSPEEFASLVAFLCSDRASYITGEQIRCDGGLVRSF
jgi:3-oxoacyl-[acyl-carrier protein] reductase